VTESLPTILSEIGALEAQMGDRGSDYWRSPEPQARYRDLVTRRQEITAPPPTAANDAVLGIATASEFQAVRGSLEHYDAYLAVMRTAADFVQAVPDADRASFVASFEALPDTVAGAICAELLNRSKAHGTSMPEQVDKFMSRPEGAYMAREWGGSVARKLGLLRSRFERVVNVLSERDSATFLSWFNGLSEGATIALYRGLTA
jgi:hypothetical protein